MKCYSNQMSHLAQGRIDKLSFDKMLCTHALKLLDEWQNSVDPTRAQLFKANDVIS